MKELKLAEDRINFKVNTSTGECFASQKVVAELCGVHAKTVWTFLEKRHPNYMKTNGIDPKMLQISVAHFALNKKKPTALETLVKLSEAGARAFIYHKAGVELTVKAELSPMQLVAQTALMIDRQQGEILKLEKEKAEKTVVELIDKKVNALEKATRGNQCPIGFLPKRKLSIFLDVPLNDTLMEMLGTVKSCRYPFSSGGGGIRYATAYKVEDARILLES